MESTEGSMTSLDKDYLVARRTADQIMHILADFIPRNCFSAAHYEMAKVCFEQGMEMNSKLMRKEYEAWKSLQLKGLELSFPSVKPEW